MSTQPFAGDKKFGTSILHKPEQAFIRFAVPKVPSWISTDQLTYSTIVWSLGIVIASYFANGNINWLWLVSFCIFLQWLTDSLDGAVGRYRNTGLIKWGYYMDHLLDYFFLCSIIIGYTLILPQSFNILMLFVLAIFSGFMINSYLSFAATNKFQITYLGIGPTEIRLMFISINILLIFFGKTHLAFSIPYLLIFSLIGILIVVSKTSKELWQMDMEARSPSSSKEHAPQ